MSTLRRLSLRNKILLFVSMLVVVPGALLGILAEVHGRSSLREVIGRELEREAGHTADRLATLLRVEEETLRSFARQDFMREIRFVDLDKRIAQALSTLMSGDASRLGYLVLDERGVVVATTNPSWLERPPGWTQPAWVKKALTDIVAEPAGEDGLLIATVIVDPDDPGRRLGTLLGRLRWSLLTEVCNEVRDALASQGLAAEIAIIGPNNQLLRRSVAIDRPSAGASEIAGLAMTMDAQAGLVADDEGEWIAGRARIEAGQSAWALLVIEPLSHALAPAARLRQRLVVTMAVALTIALTFAAYGARRVVRPLGELTEAIGELTKGSSPSTIVAVRSEDEVGMLARAFNRMISDLGAAQEKLVEAEKFGLVGQLAAGVAHEVRTSLGVLRSSAQILSRTIDPEADAAALEMVGMIEAEVIRLGGVVDDLLTLDRQRPLEMRTVRVSSPIRRAVDFVSPQATERGVAIEFAESEADPLVRCDLEAMQQVCVNLLSNAIAALETGRSITVEIEPSAEGDSEGAFRVQDNGEGIPDTLRSRIFEPFVTGRDSGVGLGLTFVKRMIHEHHGSVELVDTDGHGACFRVALPVVKEDE